MKIFTCAVLAILVLVFCLYSIPETRIAMNQWGYNLHKIDDATRYDIRKHVEDTCRATIVSYESDKLMWEQYKDSESSEQRGWADSAKIRANKAAITYNEYILKNSYVFDGNVPDDIRMELEIIK